MAQPKAKAKKGPRRQPQADRLEGLVKLQQRAVERWARYATNAVRHISSGTMNPGTWMDEYAALSSGVADDLGELMRLMFPPSRSTA